MSRFNANDIERRINYRARKLQTTSLSCCAHCGRPFKYYWRTKKNGKDFCPECKKLLDDFFARGKPRKRNPVVY